MSSLYQPLIEGAPSKAKTTSTATLLAVLTVSLCHVAVQVWESDSYLEWVALGQVTGLSLAYLCSTRWIRAKREKPVAHRVSWGLLFATFGAYFSLCILGLRIVSSVEALCMLLWGFLFAQLFARQPGSFAQCLHRSGLQLLSLLTSIFVFAYLLRTLLPSGTFGGLALFVVYFFLLIREVDLQFEPEAEEPTVPGVPRKVVSDCRPIRELMEYLGTLEGGKVCLADFLPVLEGQRVVLPLYVQKAIQLLRSARTETATFEEFLQAAHQMYMLQTQTKAPAKIITT